MPDNAVTHEMLRAGQMALIERFDAHERRYQETTSALFAKMDRAIEASHANAVSIASVNATIGKILEDRPGYIQQMHDMRADIDSLQATRDLQTGERGVLAAIAKSPFIVGLLSAAATAWAFLHGAEIKP